MSRKLAWLVGFCLPLSGTFQVSMWLPGYPDEISAIRVVTLLAWVWAVGHPVGTPLPKAPRRMLLAFGLAIAYGSVSLLWAPDLGQGLHDLVTIGLALSTGVAVILLVRGDRRALRSFALGVLIAGGLQVAVAIGEVLTGRHLSLQFGAEEVARWGLSNVEEYYGSVAWGSFGNPNDLGGYLLLSTAVFLSMGAYGIALRRPWLLLRWGVLLVSVVVAWVGFEDARAFWLGLAVLLLMHLLDRLLAPERNPVRVPIFLLIIWAGIAAAAWRGASFVMALSQGDDAIRLELFSKGFSTAVINGGFGRGLGTEKSMIDTGEIPFNFHNIVAQLAAELGLFAAGAFLAYLLVLVISWAFVTRSARIVGREASIARATVAVALVIYGATSSSVLESPHYWAFFALTAVLTGLDRTGDEAGVVDVDHPRRSSLAAHAQQQDRP